MPVFDPVEQRLAFRVVYDGMAGAGKATNLRHLRPRATPGAAMNGTPYFDALGIPSGSAWGIPLVCQLLVAGGQVAHSSRRRKLLETADVVVYVCDSRPHALAAARAGLALVDDFGRERGSPIPVVVQANWQDGIDALDGPALLAALGREAHATVVEAIAREGCGVMDTLNAAVSAATRDAQGRAEAGTLHFQVRRLESPVDLFADLAREPLEPEAAAELLLEAVAAEARGGLQPLAPATPAALGDDHGSPPPPSPDAPMGFVWPGHAGRTLLRALALSASANAHREPDGTFVHHAGDRAARTSPTWRFADGETAHDALVRSARQYTALGGLLVADTALVAQPALDGAFWIWTLRPGLASVEQEVRRGAATPEMLAAFGAALLDALGIVLDQGLGLELSARSFAAQGDAIRYVGKIYSEAPAREELAAEALASVRWLERAGFDARALLQAVESALANHDPREVP